MTVIQTLKRGRAVLDSSHIENPSLEAELLLREVLQIDRVRLYLTTDCELTPEQDDRFWSLIERRLSHEPTAYITGHREFYGLEFYVDPSVLIPRPESELLVEKTLELAHQQRIETIADIGTGCGAIAVSLAKNLPEVKIYATDASTAALEVASTNCRRHGVSHRISLLAGNLLEPLPAPVDLIIANLPYVKKSELPTVNTFPFEPSRALDGGADGLEKMRQLGSQLDSKLRAGGNLLLEIGLGQSQAVTDFLRRLFPESEIAITPDLSGIERVVSLLLPQPSNLTPATGNS